MSQESFEVFTDGDLPLGWGLVWFAPIDILSWFCFLLGRSQCLGWDFLPTYLFTKARSDRQKVHADPKNLRDFVLVCVGVLVAGFTHQNMA
jgi:hypothetical protein